MLELLKKHLINLRGAKIPNKFIVFESDDWGSIRIPDNDAREFFLSKGWIKDNDPFSKFDALESEEDLKQLFSVLSAFRDFSGRHPVITANTVVGNPDFASIEKSNFKEYHWEGFPETYKTYPQHKGAFQLFHDGVEKGLLFPQFHAREHVNMRLWLRLLQRGDERFLEAFKRKCFAIDYTEADNRRSNLMASFDYGSAEELEAVSESISSGLNYFESIFGRRSVTAIAPCYVWNDEVENVLAASGVVGLQSSKFQNVPRNDGFERRFRYFGQTNKQRQVYLVRNCLFEPALNPKIDWVQKCLESIHTAFLWGKPAIIGTHRINYVGFLRPENRERNLRLLHNLIDKILHRWPDVKFVTSADLTAHYKSRVRN